MSVRASFEAIDELGKKMKNVFACFFLFIKRVVTGMKHKTQDKKTTKLKMESLKIEKNRNM